MVKLLLLMIKKALNMSINDVTPNISGAQDDNDMQIRDFESLTRFKGLILEPSLLDIFILPLQFQLIQLTSKMVKSDQKKSLNFSNPG